ncbi:MAG: GNAT family N-acetyltransferase [Anaerolineae bacterium]
MNAWPAAIVQTLGGWRLRFNWGVTSRANSVWPNDADEAPPLEERLRIADDFYARRGAPAQYQISPASRPGDLDAHLAQCGYAIHSRTCVQTASLADVIARASTTTRIHIADECADAWFDAYTDAEGADARSATLRRGIVERIGPRTAFAHLNVDGSAAAVGMGVLERGWLGIFNMSTHRTYRRRGAATAILSGLANWAAQNGASRTYLQVVESNAPARALYEGLGFSTLYHYHYRKAPSHG